MLSSQVDEEVLSCLARVFGAGIEQLGDGAVIVADGGRASGIDSLVRATSASNSADYGARAFRLRARRCRRYNCRRKVLDARSLRASVVSSRHAQYRATRTFSVMCVGRARERERARDIRVE